MKKIICFLLSICLVLSLSSCGKNGVNPDESISSSSKEEESSASEAPKDEDVPNFSCPVALPESFDLAVENLPEFLPDVLSLREKEYEEMPLLSTQNEISEYALWNFLWGRKEFECYLPREIVPDEGTGHHILGEACKQMGAYYLFSAYNEFDMFTEDRGDEKGVYAKVKLLFPGEDLDKEAMAEALEFVMKNPVPEGGFKDYYGERAYAEKIHDFLCEKVYYSPIGYNPADTFGLDRYMDKQEAFTALGEDQDSTVCAGYARAFALIAHYAGINVAWVWGNETEVDSHAWNILYPCDGSEPVLIDVTWDDTDYEEGPAAVYDWFYIPISEVYDHFPDRSFGEFLNYLNEVKFEIE